MELNVRYVWIGFLFFLTLIFMIIFILWLNRFELDSSKYHIYYAFSKDEINGVGVNTPIKYKGISVGRVLEVDFKDIKQGIIQVKMLLDSSLDIRQGATIVVSSQGLAGANYLNLIQGSGKLLESSSERILEIDKSSLEKILSGAGKLSDDVNEILKNTILFVNEKNAQELSLMLKEIRASLEHLSSISALLDKNLKKGEYNLREMLFPTLLQIQSSLQDMSKFFNKASHLVEKIDKEPYESIFGKSKK